MNVPPKGARGAAHFAGRRGGAVVSSVDERSFEFTSISVMLTTALSHSGQQAAPRAVRVCEPEAVEGRHSYVSIGLLASLAL